MTVATEAQVEAVAKAIWDAWRQQMRGTDMSYRQRCRLVRSVGMNVVDGLALTFSCADYPDWVRDMNGWDVESAAAAIAARSVQL